MKDFLKAGGVGLCLWSAVAQAQSDTVRAWLQERAEEHIAASFRAPTSAPAFPGHGLWRERPEGAELDGHFVPPTSLAPLIRAVEASVVNITALRGGTAQKGSGRSTGSGFILSPDGFVLTNHHVVVGAQSIEVRLGDGREFPADVVGRDSSTDVALLRLRASGIGQLPSVYLGDSDPLEVGDWVVAIGNPFGLDHSVSHGMISAKERILGVGLFDDFIQTDALINPGNSGGPLFNMRGEVIGMNTAVVSQGQGIGFAVPINMVKDLLPNLKENGHLARGWLGVVIDESAASGGRASRVAVVKEVYRDSPAALAGIRPKDRFLAVNGRPIDSYLQLLRRVALLAPGSEARLTVLREGAAQEVIVKLAVRPAQTLEALAEPEGAQALGLVLQDLPAPAAAALGLAPYAGVRVSEVLPRSVAQQAGVLAGDLVVEVNRKPVRDKGQVQKALESAGAKESVLLRVQRKDLLQYLVLKR